MASAIRVTLPPESLVVVACVSITVATVLVLKSIFPPVGVDKFTVAVNEPVPFPVPATPLIFCVVLGMVVVPLLLVPVVVTVAPAIKVTL